MRNRLLTNAPIRSRLTIVAIALLMIATFVVPQAAAQTLLTEVPLPPCPNGTSSDPSCLAGTTTNTTNGTNTGIQNGVSVAVDCSGKIYYTNTWVGGVGGTGPSTNLFVINKSGTLLNTIPIKDSVSGLGLHIDEMTWDNSRGVLWGQLHGTTTGLHPQVYQINPSTGTATFEFSATHSTNAGDFFDGIAFDGSNDTLLISTDVSDTIETYCAGSAGCGGLGTFVKQITPKNMAGGTLGEISGLIVGVGDLLYLGQDGREQIVQVKKSDGSFIASFASPSGARDEGLECDSVNFVGQGFTSVLWSRDFGINQNRSPNQYFEPFLSAFSLPAGTCSCSLGGCPATQGFWHFECRWPTTPISLDGFIYSGSPNFTMTIGGNLYTQAELDAILPQGSLHTGGYVNGFSQLVAAILNIAAGAQHSTIDATITSLNTALIGQGRVVNSGPVLNPGFTAAGQAALNAAEIALDNYNGGVGLAGPNGVVCSTDAGEAAGLSLGVCKKK